MYTITKEFQFSASHKLNGLPKSHPCSRLHGHNYVLKIELKSKELNAVGFVVDYRQLDCIKRWLGKTIDHQHLNDVLRFNPTAENMAKYFYTQFKKILPSISAIEVSETLKTNARYEPTNN